MNSVGDFLGRLFGLGVAPQELDVGQVCARAALVLILATLGLRFGGKRTLGRMSALDTVVLVILGSMLSRAVNGSAGLPATLAAALLLLIAHEWFAALAVRSHRFSVFLNGRPRVLVRDGVVDQAALRRAHLTETDLLGQLRLHAHLDSPAEVREARLERDGTISVLKREASAPSAATAPAPDQRSADRA